MTDNTIAIQKGHTYVFLDSACMLALDDGGAVILVEQYRRPPAKHTFELPGGVVREGEHPKISAERELREETGFTTLDSVFLFTLDLDFSTTVHRTHVYTANILNDSKQEPGEFVVHRLTLKDIFSMVKAGLITHAPTVAATLSITAGFGSSR